MLSKLHVDASHIGPSSFHISSPSLVLHCRRGAPMHVYRWPWKLGKCSECHADKTKVLACFECLVTVCVTCDTLVSCETCGSNICIHCWMRHRQTCTATLPMCRRYRTTLLGMSNRPWWIHKMISDIPCQYCNSMRDFVGHSCEQCKVGSCHNEACIS